MSTSAMILGLIVLIVLVPTLIYSVGFHLEKKAKPNMKTRWL